MFFDLRNESTELVLLCLIHEVSNLFIQVVQTSVQHQMTKGASQKGHIQKVKKLIWPVRYFKGTE